VLQPAILANGVMGLWLTRLSDDHGFTKTAIEAKSVEQLVEELFLRAFTRPPSSAEKSKYVEYLNVGFETRVRTATPVKSDHIPKPYVSWSNHLDGQASAIMTAEEAKLRLGDPATSRLDPDWRSRMENVIWAVINSAEMIHRP
jgi:hypothetical protein